MLIHLVPVTRGITRENPEGRPEAGWVHAGRQAIRCARCRCAVPRTGCGHSASQCRRGRGPRSAAR
jgi:hypothetical protein